MSSLKPAGRDANTTLVSSNISFSSINNLSKFLFRLGYTSLMFFPTKLFEEIFFNSTLLWDNSSLINSAPAYPVAPINTPIYNI